MQPRYKTPESEVLGSSLSSDRIVSKECEALDEMNTSTAIQYPQSTEYSHTSLETLPTISVVVAFRKSEHCVIDCLRSIFAMDYPDDRLDVVVIDDNCDDSVSGEVRAEFPNVRLLRNRTPVGCDGSKQAGIDASKGVVIALTDADCTVHPLWGTAIVTNLANGADVVTGPVRHPRTLLRELIAVADFRDAQSERLGWVDAFPGCNFAVGRAELVDTRYDRSGDIRGGSDRLVSWEFHRYGRRIRYDPLMLVYHNPSVTFKSLLVRRMLYGRVALGMRKIDPTLPGGYISRLGPLAALPYIVFKFAKDAYMLLHMTSRSLIHPLHVPLLLPLLILFRLADAYGMITGPDKNCS